MELPEGETGSVGVASSATSASQEQVLFNISTLTNFMSYSYF